MVKTIILIIQMSCRTLTDLSFGTPRFSVKNFAFLTTFWNDPGTNDTSFENPYIIELLELEIFIYKIGTEVVCSTLCYVQPRPFAGLGLLTTFKHKIDKAKYLTTLNGRIIP